MCWWLVLRVVVEVLVLLVINSLFQFWLNLGVLFRLFANLTEKEFLEFLQFEEFIWFLMANALLLTIDLSNDGFIGWKS